MNDEVHTTCITCGRHVVKPKKHCGRHSRFCSTECRKAEQANHQRRHRELKRKQPLLPIFNELPAWTKRKQPSE